MVKVLLSFHAPEISIKILSKGLQAKTSNIS